MEALGIDLKLLIAQIVNFVVLFLVLSKFLYKPITKMLSDREEKICKGLKDSENAEKCLGQAKENADKIKDDAFKEADKIISEAKKEASEKAASIVKKANDQADKILKNADEEAGMAKERALKEAKKELSNVVVMALDKIVGEEIDANSKAKLTEQAIKEL
ncbi:MAG: F0F1 ATP synthase subunit B [Patescibacteria group bacterium]